MFHVFVKYCSISWQDFRTVFHGSISWEDFRTVFHYTPFVFKEQTAVTMDDLWNKVQKKNFAFFSVKSKNGSWIHNIYTTGGFFWSNLNSNFWDSPPERVFGKRSEKSIFEERFSIQKWHTTVTARELNFILTRHIHPVQNPATLIK